MAHVSVRGLTKQYATGRGIRGIDFDAHPGRVTGLIGPNGSGKSTTMRCMVGLVRSSGSVTYGGATYAEAVRAGGVGIQLGGAGTHPARSGRAHLRCLAAARGIPRSEVEELLEAVELGHVAGRRIRTYSLGMRQRLGLAAALVGHPMTYVLDEPTNGLDPHGIRWLGGRLAHEAARGATVLVTSHALGDLEQIVDDLVILRHGQVRFTGPLEDVIRTFGDDAVLVRLGAGASLVERDLVQHGASVSVQRDGAFLVRGVSAAVLGRVAHAVGAEVLELSPRSGDLHEAYLTACGDAS